MNKTYLKNNLRDIKNTKGKVLSIAIMIGLATLVVVAMTLTGPSMRNTLNNSLNAYEHPDIIVKSTYGLDYEDDLIISKDKDIEKITKIKASDLLIDDNLIRVKAYNENIKKSVLTKGYMPRKKDEIALEDSLEDSYKIGDKIKLKYIENSKFDEKALKNLTYEVVGFYKSSDHFMEDMKELSFAAKKELSGYAYVLEENFDTDKFSEINIVYKNTDNLDKTSKDYEKFVEDKKEKIEKDISNRPKEVLEKIKKDSNDDIKKAQNDIDSAKKELSDGEKKLEDAKEKLDKGFKDYEKGKKTFDQKILDGKKSLEFSKKELIDGEKKLKDGQKEYEENLAIFNDKIKKAEEEIAKNENDLKNGQKQIDEGYLKINQGYKLLDDEFSKAREKLNTGKVQLDKAKENIDQKENELSKLELLLNQSPQKNLAMEIPTEYKNLSPSDLLNMKAQLEEAKNQYNEGLNDYKANKLLLDNKYNDEKSKIDDQKALLDQKQSEINSGKKKLTEAKSKLEIQKAQGKQELDKANNKISNSKREIADGWQKYNEGIKDFNYQKQKGEKELRDNNKKLLDGKDEYDKNLEKFTKEKNDAQKEIADGEVEIEDGKDALARLVDPKYTVENIFENQGINTYYQNSLNMDQMTKVFPTFFYLVAMLVSLTTMKRFIDEQRVINGTLKSLGYTNSQISQRFYFYGLIPTIIGSIIGAIFGRFIVAEVIIKAYSSGFNNLGIDYVNPISYMAFAILLSAFLIAITVHLSSNETVRETPASLLRGKSPEVGKKILMEKISPIWKRLSFLQKITARNLFRYKSRMFMTLFGVGGCTALTFFGFAMIDSIKDTVNLQKNAINHYDVVAAIDEKSKGSDLASFYKKIEDFDHLQIKMQEVKITKNNEKRKLNFVVFNDTDNLDKFVSLHTNKRKAIDLSKEEAVITEKAFNKLNLKKNDLINFDKDGKEIKVKVTNFSENYTGDFIYMTKDNYEQITGEKYQTNAVYLKGDSDKIIKKIENENCINAITNTSVVYASIDVLMANLNLVIGVITLISIMLALVVLYNLININVSERKRELATIKVLGFYPKEVTSYISREISILTLLGILLGYVLGILMFRYVIAVVAPDNILLAYRTHPTAYIFSGVLTILILLVLIIFVHKNLKKIDMAEAMSSGE